MRTRSVVASMLLLALPLALLLILPGCSAEKSDWQSAQSADTVEAYEQFISKHPQSALASEARERTKQLAEEKDWEKASSIDTMDSYQAFLGKYPEGKWSEEARIRIENFSVLGVSPSAPADAPAAAAADAAAADTTAAAAPKPAKPAEAPKAAAVAKPAPAAKADAPPKPAAAVKPPAAANGYRIQLGALSTAEKANSEWQRLQAKHGAQLAALAPSVVAANTTAGKLYRLQAPVASEAKARSVCAALVAAGQACIVVAPK
jgi:cell division septation protein DedD